MKGTVHEGSEVDNRAVVVVRIEMGVVIQSPEAAVGIVRKRASVLHHVVRKELIGHTRKALVSHSSLVNFDEIFLERWNDHRKNGRTHRTTMHFRQTVLNARLFTRNCVFTTVLLKIANVLAKDKRIYKNHALSRNANIDGIWLRSGRRKSPSRRQA